MSADALLAMTMGSKCVFLNSLTTPGCAHPSNGGELGMYHRGPKFPSVEGWRALRDGVVYSIAHASVYSYVPVASVYDTPTGAYIMHEPPGLDAIQLVAVPADV